MEAEDFRGYKMIYPQSKELPQGMPDDIYKAYTQAEKVKQIAPEAYGVLLGRILEMICQDKGAKAKTLANWLEDLKNTLPDVKVVVQFDFFRVVFWNLLFFAEIRQVENNDY
jgi:hypothetical protein